MSKPYIHAESSAKRWGGRPEDYIAVHDFMDSSKGAICDNRHRALTHNSWFLSNVLERIFGHTILNSAGFTVSVRDIGEWHVFEDYGCRFIPTAQDFLQEIELKDWMDNGKGQPPDSSKKIAVKPTNGTKRSIKYEFPKQEEVFPSIIQTMEARSD